MTEVTCDHTVEEFLSALAARAPAPAAGAGAAVTIAMAAALVAKAARFTTGALGELASTADQLRARVLPLADADGEAYAEVLAASRLPRQHPNRADRLSLALTTATDVPLRIAQAGAEVASLAARLAREGNPNLRGDAQAAVLLAEGATRAAAAIVHLNRKLGRLAPEWDEQAATHQHTSSEAARSAMEGAP